LDKNKLTWTSGALWVVSDFAIVRI